MESEVRFGDVARMVGAQLCFVGAAGPAVVAGMLVCDRLVPDILITIGVMMAIAAGATGVGVVLLSRRVRDGYIAAMVLTFVLLIALYFVCLVSNLFDLRLSG